MDLSSIEHVSQTLPMRPVACVPGGELDVGMGVDGNDCVEVVADVLVKDDIAAEESTAPDLTLHDLTQGAIVVGEAVVVSDATIGLTKAKATQSSCICIDGRI